MIACGDTRFTDPSNVTATNPRARNALIARIAEERPDAVVIGLNLTNEVFGFYQGEAQYMSGRPFERPPT